jgi:uncharacterized protein YodC (DUF2158 family)
MPDQDGSGPRRWLWLVSFLLYRRAIVKVGEGTEMDLTFKPGDVVQLNSGGPKMTVVAVQSDGTLRCIWFQEDGKQDNGVFVQVALRAAKTKS